MSASTSTSQFLRVILVTTAMIVAVWQLVPIVSVWQREHLANRLAADIDLAKDSQVKVPLRQMAELGAPALQQLVKAAASQRVTVAITARQILAEKVATWQQHAESSAQWGQQLDASLTNLAAGLAAHIDRFGPAGKQWAERLTLDLIDLADAIPAEQASPLLADCNRILAAVPPRSQKVRTVTTFASPNSSKPQLESPQPGLETLTQTSEVPRSITPPNPTRTTLDFQTRTSPLPLTSTPQDSTWSPAWQEQQKLAQPMPKTRTVDRGSNLRKLPKPSTNVVEDVPSPLAMKNLAMNLRELPTEELLDRISNSDFYEAGVTGVVLRERGFAPLELALLQRLDSPTAADRMQILTDLADLPAASARRVLRRLLKDENPEVRLRALTAIATTNDPSLGDLAHELAIHDVDSRVSELASRILKQVR